MPSATRKTTELLTSSCPTTARMMGLEAPTREDHTELTVDDYEVGSWFTIRTDEGCVELSEDAFRLMAKDGLAHLERRDAAKKRAAA